MHTEFLTKEEAKVKAPEMEIQLSFFESEYGLTFLALTGEGKICALEFLTNEESMPGSKSTEEEKYRALTELKEKWPGAKTFMKNSHQKTAVTSEDDKSLKLDSDSQLLLQGTPFQIEVWKALLQIPSGQERSYSQIAEQIGRPKATRAVGTAIGKNPIALHVPCHRVRRSDGTLGGYRWGLKVKKQLLKDEGLIQ
jgi:AraC family transcriptional regulator of adaptative response/methylated-DNA-[protein]-cysteine methyltransferase